MKIACFLVAAIVAVIFFKIPLVGEPEKTADSVDWAGKKNLSDCFLKQNICRIKIQKGHVALEIPQMVPSGKTFEMRLQSQDLQINSIQARFEGLSMAMFAPDVDFFKKDAGGKIWLAHALLPICVTGKMRWKMTIFVNQSIAFSGEVESE